MQLTEKIQLSGDHLVYLPNSNYVAISHQLDHEERECLRKEIAGWLRTPEGIIVRSKAGRKSAAVLIRELNQLRSEWRSLLKRSAAMKAPGRVCRRLSLLSSILNENHRPESCTVFSNIPVDNDEKISAGVDMIYEPADNLFAVHDLEKIWRSVEQPGVPLPKGASIAIEHTAALTAIDVNTGSRVVGDHWEEQALSINLDAAREIGRQLRLRGIGGMVAVDFLRLHKHENRDRVIDELERVTAQDPATVKIFGYSEMGLVELTRKRTRREAADRN
ncbi:ribonuclease E/G [Sporolactobacillus sp. Y61]|uniref:Ribonuclease E/G n=1 Tax=Sporolactobacillus sp. Y61 TaxID=3160863 RepID=A0AAU8IEI3_9BACL